MSVKDDIEAIKTEIVGESKLLEYFIRFEKVFKKFKIVIISGVAILVVGSIGNSVYDYLENSRLEEANSAYKILLKDPNNTSALNKLKEKNINLYDLYTFQKSIKDKDFVSMEKLSKRSDFLGQLALYQLASLKGDVNTLKMVNAKEGSIFKDLAALQSATIYFEKGEIENGLTQLKQIPFTSSYKQNADALAHYGVASK